MGMGGELRGLAEGMGADFFGVADLRGAAARLAGPGWIGRSCLLVTPEAGPRVRWGTVLTDADLPCGPGPIADRCGKCEACVKACPAGAFTGRAFREEEPVEVRYDRPKCRAYQQGVAVCGLCIAVCPHGRKGA
jgi:epoxyqueuosine reductase QueG